MIKKTSNRVIKNCIITQEDSEVLKEYTIAVSQKDNHTGIDIKAEEVICPCLGVVIQVIKFEKLWSVVIQYSEDIALRFANLESVYVEQGQLIKNGVVIGKARKFVHFEYVTPEENEHGFKVRIPPRFIFWTHDPNLILGRYIAFNNIPVPETPIPEIQALMEDGLGANESSGELISYDDE